MESKACCFLDRCKPTRYHDGELSTVNDGHANTNEQKKARTMNDDE